jgi:hypothetical protein
MTCGEPSETDQCHECEQRNPEVSQYALARERLLQPSPGHSQPTLASEPATDTRPDPTPEGKVDTRGDHRGLAVTAESPLVPSGRDAVPHGRGAVYGDELARYDAARNFARFVLSRAGLEIDDRGWQSWALPHDRLTVRVGQSSSGLFQVFIEGHATPKPLAFVYAATIAGVVEELGRGEFPRWKRRALLEAGMLDELPIRLARLPDLTPTAVPELWAAIELLVKVRVAGGDAPCDPLPLSRTFLRRWAAMTDSRVRAAMEFLEREKCIEKVGAHGRTYLWRVLAEEESER